MYRSTTTTPSNKRVFGACLLSFMTLIAPIASIAAASPNNRSTSAKTTPAPVKESNQGSTPSEGAPGPNSSESLNAQQAAFFLSAAGGAASVNSPFASASAGVNATSIFLPAFADVTATMAAVTFPAVPTDDVNNDGNVDPGDKIAYSVLLNNPLGGDPNTSGLSFNVPVDPHTTLVPGSIQSTPVTFDKVVAPFNEDSPAQSIVLQGQDPDGTNVTFAIVGSPTRGTLGAIGSPSCVAGVCSATVNYTPTLNEFGTDSFTFKVNDGIADSNQVGTVSITITSVNDAPTFTPHNPANPGLTVNEDVSGQTLNSFVTAISPGPTNESGQTVNFVIDNFTHSALFAVAPAISASGILTYTPAGNANGTSTVTYHLHDNGGTANTGVDNSSPNQTFTITVNAVNDAPVALNKAFTVETNMKISGLTGLLTGVSDPDATNGAADPLSFDAAAPAYTTPSVSLNNIAVGTCQTNPALPALPTTATVTVTSTATGTFNFDPAPGMTGTCVLKYQVTDTGKGSGGNQTSAQADITITHNGPVIWFVDPSRATDGNGTLSDTSTAIGPFKLLASANAKLATSGANQRVFVYSGTTAISATEILQLQSGHWLIGQGVVASDFDTFFGLTGGSAPPAGTIARPTVNSNAATANAARPTIRGAVTVKDSSVVQGVNIDVSAGSSAGLAGSLLGGTSVIVIKDVNVTSGSGSAVDISSSVATSSISYTTSDATNSPNILSSTTGIALRVVSTSIGLSGLNFKRISAGTGASGPASGIVLNNTGTTVGTHGRLIVNGDGNGSLGGNSSGGTIQHTSSHGISLTQTLNPSFTNMNIHDNGGSGINGSRVTNFTFANGTIDIVGTSVTADDANISFNDNLNNTFANVTGTVSITNSILNHARYHGVDIQQDTGTLSDLTISGNTFTSDSSITTSLGSAVRLIALGNATTVANVTKATLANNTITNFNTGAGFVLNGGNSQDTAGAPAGTYGDPAVPANVIAVTGNLMNGGTLGVANQPDRFVTGSVNGRGQGHITVSNNGTLANPIKNIDGVVIELNAFGSATLKVHVDNNIITSNNAVGSAGINVGCDADSLGTTTDNAVMTAFVSGNNVSDNDGVGILAIARGASTCTLNATIKNNNFAAPDTTASARAGIRVDSGSTGSNNTVCLDITGNTTAGSTSSGTGTKSPGINLRRQTTGTNVFGIKGMAATATPGVENFVNGQNTSASGTFGVGGTALLSGTTGFSNCASSPLSFNQPENSDQHYAFAVADDHGTSSLLAFLDTKDTFASIFESLDRATHSVQDVPNTNSAQQSWLSAKAAIAGANSGSSNAASISQLLGRVTSSLAKFANSVDSLIVPTVHAEAEKTEIRTQKPDVRSEFASARTSRSDIRLNHAPKPRAKADESVPENNSVAPSLANNVSIQPVAPMFAGGTFPINGTGPATGFALPNGKTTTITFKVTVNNPPNFSSPTTNQVSQQGALTGLVLQPSTVLTDDQPGTAAPNEPTLTTVDLFDTTTTLSASPTAGNWNAGQPITFTASVASNPPGNPTAVAGTVNFYDGAILVGNIITGCNAVAVSSGQAQCVKAFAPGSHTITAVYSGDGNFDPSTSATLSQTVNKSNTTTAVTLSSLNPSKVTQNVTFTATVTSSTGFAGPPTGTLTFKDGSTTICNLVVMSGGSAQCSISSLTAGAHNINVFYSSDANFNASDNTAAPFVQTVNKSDTSTTLGSNLNPSLVSQSVTFTATVTSSGVPFTSTGNVTFKDGVTTIGTCSAQTISGGNATCILSNLTAGTHNITAVYNGDPTFNASPASNIVAQVVNKSNTSTALISSKNPASPGDTVTFTATVTSSGVTFTNTGTVAFYDGPVGPATIILGCETKPLNGSSQATCPVTGFTEATHNITAVYSGDPTFNTSTSNVVAQVISKTTPTVVVTSSVNPSSASQSVTFTAKVTSSDTAQFPGPPAGTIQFKDGVTNIGGTVTLTAGACPGAPIPDTVCATVSTATLTAGTHTITADYVGDGTANGSATFNNSSGSLPGGQVVNKTNTTTAVTSSGPNPSRVTESVTFTATVTFTNAAIVGPPTGNVTFKYGGVTIPGCTAQALNGSAVATCATSTVPANALPAGSHTITADYNGDLNFNTSTGSFPGNPQVVNKSDTTTTIVSSLNPSPVALDPVMFTATVTFAPGVTGPPTGTVTFKDGANPIPTCTAQPVDGSAQATCTVVLSQGTHNITAVYNGDNTFNASPPSNTIAQVIGTCTASVVVTTSADDGAGSLRQALIDVCDPGTITFAPGVTLITLTTAELTLNKDLMITGPGANLLTVERSSAGGTPNFRIFNLIAGKTVTISGMTVTNGNVVGANGPPAAVPGTPGASGNPENGGGIFNNGTLTLLNVIVSSNHATGGNGGITSAAIGGDGGPAHGGGIFSSGTLTLTNTTVDGNNTATGGNGGNTDGAFANGNGGEGFGGGIFNNGTLPLTIENSTISGNTATGGAPGTGGTGGVGVAGNGSGGGIFTGTVAAVLITNSTISGNQATNDGGGIYNLGGPSSTTLTSVTMTLNRADMDANGSGLGGGMKVVTGQTTLKNTIVAGNLKGAASPSDIDGSINTSGSASTFNLIGDSGTSGGLIDGTDNNIVGADISTILNTTLANNGGPTKTHALIDGSPALEKGKAFGLTTDQRGFQRPVDFDATVQGGVYDESDIGAFERQLAFPTIAKAFSPTTIQAGSMSNITLTLSNTNTSALTGASFTDTLASNLVAVGGTVGGSCTGADSNSLTLNQAGLLSFSGITIPAAGSCTVIFAVTSGTPGSYPNSTSGVTTTQTTTAGPVSNTDTLTVLAAPTIAKGFSPTAIASGGTSTITLTLGNSNAIPLTGASFTDTLVNMSAAGGAVTTSCGGAPLPASLTLGETALSFSGITIPAGGSCTVAFDVTSSTAGINPNSTSGVTTAQTTTPGTGSNIATLAVTGTPSIVKSFSPTAIQSGGNSTVTLTLNNGNPSPLTNASFTDTLVNMSAVGGAVGGTCIGTAPNALPANATALSFSGIQIPAGSSCTVTFVVKSSTVGVNPNSTSGVTTNETATGAASAPVNLTVLAAPTIGKAFNSPTIQSGGTSTVTLTLSNSNATTALTGGSFTDTLVNMSAVGGPVGGDCGALPNSLVANATALSFSGITIPAAGSCTVTFAVKSSTVGTNPNATSGVTTAETPTAGPVSNTANLTVLAAPTIGKTFSLPTIQSGGTSTVTLTLSNSNATTALTGASFSDTLANMSAVGGPVGGTCGALPNSLAVDDTALSFSGITIPAAGSCTVTFAVKSSTVGTNPNTTSGVTTAETPTPGAVSNTANLTVLAAPTITKAFGPPAIQSGANSTVTLTLSNSNATTLLTGASFTDTLAANLMAVGGGGAVGGTCTGAAGNTLTPNQTGLLSFSGITIPIGGSCTVTFAVTSSTPGTYPNSTSGVTTTQTTTPGPVSNTDTLTVLAAPTIAKVFSPTAIQTGGTSTVTLTLSNSNPSMALTNGSFTDTLVNMSAVGGAVGGDCGATPNTLAANATALNFSGITIPAGGTCTVTFDVKSSTLGTNPNATSGVTTTETTTPGTVSNTANLSVFAPPVVVSILRANASPTNAATVDFTVTFSKPVTGVDTTDFTTTSGGIVLPPNPVTTVTPAGPADTYTVTVSTGTGDGSLRLDLVDDDSIVSNEAVVLPLGGSGAGNGNFNAGQVYTISKSDPFVTSITHADPDPTNAAIVHFTVIFGKPVTGVNIAPSSDFALATTGTIAGASITGLSGSGTTYTVTVDTGTGNGTIRLDVLDDDTIVDSGARPLGGVGAGNGATTGLSDAVIVPYTIDKTAPTVTLAVASNQANPSTGPTATTTIRFKAVFSESVTGLTAAGIDITGTSGASLATITEVAPDYPATTQPLDGTTYEVSISGMTQSGNVTAQVKINAAQDAAGNNNTAASATATVVYNKDDFASLEVNTTADTDDLACTPLGTGNGCTLREAIKAANADFGAETITFNIPTADPGYNVGTGVYTIDLTGALPDLSSSMTISGLGAKVLTVRRNTGGTYRIFTILSGVTVNISGLTVTNGLTATGAPGLTGGNGENGGAIHNSGTLILTGVAVSGNRAGDGGVSTQLAEPGGRGGQGGGIFNQGNLTLTNSTVSGNQTGNAGSSGPGGPPGLGGYGGGISNGNGGTLTVSNSTISGNQTGGTGGGAGIINAVGGTLTVSNSTITGNTAPGGPGGGIYREGGTVTIKNTIVGGGNTATVGPDIYGAVNSEGFSLIQSTSPIPPTETLNPGTNITGQDPLLFPLADNGGGTMTHALQCVSPAIDKGFNFSLNTDQRGGTRPFDLADSVYANAASPGNGSDIGAYEVQSGGGCLPLAVSPGPQSTNEDTAKSITLTGTYSQNTPLSFTITEQPAHGAALVPSASNCVFTTFMTCTATVNYSPSANYFGPDTFKFIASAGSGPGALNSDEAVVDITVNPVNDPPVAVGDPSQTTAEDTPLPITLNGSDIDGGPLTFSIVTGPAHGSLSPVSGTAVTYSPNPDYNGPDSFTFKVNDTFVDSNTATVGIVVSEVNDAPTAVNDALSSVAEDSGMRTISIASLLVNDLKGPANENGQTLTFSLVPGSESGGTISSDATNVYFTPPANYNGPASFQYTVTDNGTTNGALDPKISGAATVSFTVFEVNDAPTAVGETLSTVAEDPGPLSIPFAALTVNDSTGPADESGQLLIVNTVGNPVGGTVSIAAGNVIFTPASDFNGLASFDYTVEDNGTTNGVAAPLSSGIATASFVITQVNDAPVTVNDTLTSSAEDSAPRAIPFADLTGNDSKGSANESGQTLTVILANNAVGGSVVLVPGFVVFTPFENYNGPASFNYVVQDNGTTNGVADPKTSGSGLVQFNITEVNDAPTAINDTLGDVAEDSGERTITFADLTANDLKGPADESGQTLIVKTVSNPVGVTVSIVEGTVRITPLPDFSGAASFQYTVRDNGTTSGFGDEKTSAAATVSFNITAQGDAPSVTNATTNANTQTTSGLVISRNPADGPEVTHFKITAITGGTLFKNDGVTPINNGDFITFAEGNAGLKFTPGTSNGSFTVQASTSASDAGLSGGTATATITVNSVGGVLRFSSGFYNVAEGAGSTTITVERTGDASQAVTVDYASSDHSNPPDFIPCNSPGAGFASSRCDFTTAIGTLRFAAGEASKTFNVLISNDNYVEGPETLELTLSNPTGGAVFGVPQTATLTIIDDATEPAANPIDTSIEFVRAQYHDMLNREPDAPGLAFWTDNIEKCNDPDRRPADQTAAQCIDKQRESTAVAFFMSPEFKITGGFVYHLYKGSLTGTPNYDGGSPGRFPTALEFLRDVSNVSEGIVVGNQISGAVVEANRNRLAAEFVQRPEFVAKYGGLNNTLYVEELFNTTGIAATAAEKQALVDGLTGGTETRSSVLRKVVDGTVVISESNVQFTTPYGQAFINQENSRVFVFMEYVGYLRRNPDQAGFVFWLGKLNTYGGDPFQAEMVRSFILSPEYRNRFGQP